MRFRGSPFGRYPRHRLRGPQQSQEHHDAALVLAWIIFTDAAEGALATEESDQPSLGQVHPEVQAAYLPLDPLQGTSQLPSNQTSEANGCDYQFEGKCRVRYEMRGPTLQSERSNRTPVSVGYSKNPTTWEPTPLEIMPRTSIRYSV